MSRPRPIAADPSHEDAFAQRYRTLLGWALRLTNHNREQAEDLVHDAFVHFMISRVDLATIQSLDGYLYGMLRNLHVSQVRRALRMRESAFPISDILSISDTASVHSELRAAGQRLQVQDDLCRICQYASIRKNNSKIGSVVILRFFHGYYPNEIAAVAGSSRPNVDKMLQRARAEARLYLKDPESLGFLSGQKPPALEIKFGQEPQDFLSELRNILYRSCPGECPSSAQLRAIYQTDCRISPELLAHIVCCAVCLDEVNRLLDLPLLAEREPEKMTGRDRRDRHDGGGGPGDGASGTGDYMDKPRRRLKEVLAHRPKELRVSVNGFILGSHTINSEFNKLSISAKGEEKIGFVEVFSEEEVRLLFCTVQPPPEGPVERTILADLSDDRSLELFLDFSDSWPALDVTYRDPTFETGTEPLAFDQSLRSASVKFDRAEDGGDEVSTGSGSDRVGVQRPMSKVQSPLGGATRLLEKILPRRPAFGRWTFDIGLFLRPGTITALFALVFLLAAVLIYKNAPPARFSAADLLQRAIASEDTLAANRDQVIHRTLRLEERSSAGQLISSRRIEIWHSAEKGITARRLYDENGSLIAGDWRRADGVQTIYHHGRKPELQLGLERRGRAAINFETIWQLDPAAKAFAALVGGAQTAQAQATDSAYIINYADSNATSSGLVGASLVMRRTDLRAFEQTLVVRQAGEAREYKFTEISFETRRSDSVAPAVFEPESELVSSLKLETPNSKLETSSDSPLALGPSPVMATAALEVQVIEALSNANAFMGEQVKVTRGADGKVSVAALVETDQRKRDLLSAMSPFRNNPAVVVHIDTVAEAEAKAQRSTSAAVTTPSATQVQVGENEAPAFAELKKRFSEEEAHRYSNRVMTRAQQAWLHAAAMKQLSQRFSAADLQSLAPAERSRWLGLIRRHAESFLREMESLRRELAQVFAEANINPSQVAAIGSDAELQARVRELHDASVYVLQNTERSFGNGAGASGSIPVKSSGFWASFARAWGIAKALQSVK